MSDGTSIDIYGAMIAELESKIAVMQATVANLQSLRGGGPIQASVASPQASAMSGQIVAFNHDSFFGMTAAEAGKKYLGSIRKTATIQAISDDLVRYGWKTSAKNIPENLRTILGRHPDFVRVNGEFGLSEWYPGRKVVAKKRSQDSGEYAEAPGIGSEESGDSSDVLPSQ